MVDHPAFFPLLLKNIPVVSDCGSESTQERRGGGFYLQGTVIHCTPHPSLHSGAAQAEIPLRLNGNQLGFS